MRSTRLEVAVVALLLDETCFDVTLSVETPLEHSLMGALQGPQHQNIRGIRCVDHLHRAYLLPNNQSHKEILKATINC